MGSNFESLRRAFAERRWRWRGTFSRENLIAGAKNLAWVGPLTLLIWIWAEREQTQEIGINDVPVQVISSDPNRFVESASGAQTKVTLRLKGPQATLDRVRERLTSGIPRGIEINIRSSLGRGNNQSLNVLDQIQNQPLFRDSGVTVTESQPSTIAVNVDDMGSRETEVQIPPTVTNLTPATTFDPRKVKLVGPESALRRLEAQGQLRVLADISPGSDAVRSPGRHELPALELKLPVREERVTITPLAVHAVLDVRAADVPALIGSIPITIDAAPAFLDTYRVVLSDGDTIANIHVSGPQQQIDLLNKRQYPMEAVLKVSRDDIGREEPRRLKFDLGDGVRVDPADANKTVEFKLVKRDTGNG